MSRSPETPAQETLSRVRRIETRLTQTMIALGVTTDVQQPVLDLSTSAPTLHVRSRHSSLQEVMGAIPADILIPVNVFVGGDYLMTVSRMPPRLPLTVTDR